MVDILGYGALETYVIFVPSDINRTTLYWFPLDQGVGFILIEILMALPFVQLRVPPLPIEVTVRPVIVLTWAVLWSVHEELPVFWIDMLM